MENTTPTGDKAEFHIDSEQSASWLLRKLRGIEEEKLAVRAATDQRIAELEADRERLMGRFGSELEAWARSESEKRRRKTITIPLAGCAVAFRTVPACVVVEPTTGAEIATMLGFVKAPAPDLAAFRKHAQEHLESTGELLPGVMVREAEKRFSIRLPKGSESPEE